MELLCFFLSIYSLLILARIILSWVRIDPDSSLSGLNTAVFNLTEPVLGPLRRAIPPVRLGMAALDLSPIIVFVVIRLICS